MIRGVVLHLLNEQPVVVDLINTPTPSDVGLLCTNIRTLDGKKPIFVDLADSILFFPYLNVRFVEMPRDQGAGAMETEGLEGGAAAPTGEEEDLQIDEDFLRRVREA